jgi:formylglycine-generating enzyme required for sulfatase activity
MCRRSPVLGMRIMICISLILSYSTSARDKSDKAATDYVVVGESQIALVKIAAGTFQMGTAQVLKAEDDWDDDVEHPVHEVRITKTFWMGEFPVTQRE